MRLRLGRSPGFFQQLYYGSFPTDTLQAEYRDRGTSAVELRRKLQSGSVSGFAKLQAAVKNLDDIESTGFYGMSLPVEFGGLDLSHTQIAEIVRGLSESENTEIILELHRRLVVASAILHFGAQELKAAYLPRLARGESALCAPWELREGKNAEPSAIDTTATIEGGDFKLTGEKILPTGENSPHIIAVTARGGPRGVGLFVLESGWEGVSIEKDEGNAWGPCRRLRLDGVRVPARNLIGEIGSGDHHAQVAADLARLVLASCVGSAKQCLETARGRAELRCANGNLPGEIGRVAEELTDIASRLFAMEAVSWFSADLVDRDVVKHRRETSAALAFHGDCERAIIADTLRILHGSGASVDAAVRDAALRRAAAFPRQNPTQDLAREATERHILAIGTWSEPTAGKSKKKKFLQLLGILAFYFVWYPLAWIGWSWWPRFRAYGRLAKHLRFAEKNGRRLARASFHGMLLYGTHYREREAFHERLAEIGLQIFGITATVAHVQNIRQTGTEGARAEDLADVYCRSARRGIENLFRNLWRNEDILKDRTAREVLNRRYLWLE